jgi:hypothetical protein
MPPGDQYTELPSIFPRPMPQYFVRGTPRFLLSLDDELPLAA